MKRIIFGLVLAVLLVLGAQKYAWSADSVVYIPTTTSVADPTDGTVMYIGRSQPGVATSAAKWQITKLTFTAGNFTGQKWADGNGNYDNVWNDRASLTYQ